MSASTMTATAAFRRSASPTTRWRVRRSISSSAAGTARGEHWGYEVRGVTRSAGAGASRTYEAWQKAGVTRADGKPFPQPNRRPRSSGSPVPGGPVFLLGPNFYAVRSYNPSMNYTMSIVHLGDRVMGGGPFVQPFPGAERTPTLAEVQEIQQRLTALGFDTGGTDGRVGNDTMAGDPEIPAQGRHVAGRRLCRRQASGAVASGPRDPVLWGHLSQEPKDHPVTTAKANAAPAAAQSPANKAHPSIRELDRPVNLSPANTPGWGSDVVADTLRALQIPYIALNPGASYRGLHDSIVNFLGNETPQMLLCLHEEAAVAIAHGYAKVTGKAMAAAVHSNVGLFHATMAIFNAWCDRMPVIVLGATGPVDAAKRRPWIDWIHTARDQGAIVRNYTKWDDQPASPAAAREALHARQLDRQHGADGPGLHQSRRRDAGSKAR